MEHLLGTETLGGVLLHIRVHWHHVVLAVELKAVASEEEESIHILAKQRLKVLHSLEYAWKQYYEGAVSVKPLHTLNLTETSVTNSSVA